MTDRLMLLDTASLYFRAFYGVPDKVKAADGSSVNAVRGLLDMIAKLVATYEPTRLVACWDDDWRPQWRVDLLPSYKAHRVVEAVPVGADVEEVPDPLEAQIPLIREALAVLGIPVVGAAEHEADDVIGTLTAREVARPAGERTPVLVVTGDRDLFQLVDDEVPVRVLYTIRGIKDIEVVDAARLRERYAVSSGGAYADMAVLRGDPSDGLPGVAGIGEKTAASMLAKYGDLPGLLAARDAGDRGLTATQRQRLTDADDYLAVAPGVVRVAADAPVRLADGTDPAAADAFALPREPVDGAALVDLTARWGLESSVRRVLTALANR